MCRGWSRIPTFALAGFGMGLAYSPIALIVLREAPPEAQGSASSALSLTDSLGTALGTGVAGAIIAAGIRSSGQPVPGLAIAFAVALAVGFGGLLLTPRLRHRRRCPRARDDGRDLAAGVDGRTACGRLRDARHAAAHRRCVADDGGHQIVSAEELRAKIREVPDFPKPGILFYDITTLLKDPEAYREAIDLMLAPYAGEEIDIVVGMESRGFIFSAPMAYQLGAGLVRCASWASSRPRRSRSSTPSNTARTRSRSTATRSSPARRS